MILLDEYTSILLAKIYQFYTRYVALSAQICNSESCFPPIRAANELSLHIIKTNDSKPILLNYSPLVDNLYFLFLRI